MKTINSLTFEELEALINETPASSISEGNYREEILCLINENKLSPYFENLADLMSNIEDEEHDGAYTFDETQFPFTKDDIETYNFTLNNKLNNSL